MQSDTRMGRVTAGSGGRTRSLRGLTLAEPRLFSYAPRPGRRGSARLKRTHAQAQAAGFLPARLTRADFQRLNRCMNFCSYMKTSSFYTFTTRWKLFATCLRASAEVMRMRNAGWKPPFTYPGYAPGSPLGSRCRQICDGSSPMPASPTT